MRGRHRRKLGLRPVPEATAGWPSACACFVLRASPVWRQRLLHRRPWSYPEIDPPFWCPSPFSSELGRPLGPGGDEQWPTIPQQRGEVSRDHSGPHRACPGLVWAQHLAGWAPDSPILAPLYAPHPRELIERLRASHSARDAGVVFTSGGSNSLRLLRLFLSRLPVRHFPRRGLPTATPRTSRPRPVTIELWSPPARRQPRAALENEKRPFRKRKWVWHHRLATSEGKLGRFGRSLWGLVRDFYCRLVRFSWSSGGSREMRGRGSSILEMVEIV